MQFPLLLTLASMAVCTLAAPTTRSITKRLAENEPWHLTNLTIFTAAPGYRNSTIDFHFSDSNPSLELEVSCSRSVLGGIVDAEKYHPCSNNTVGFRWDGNTLDIRRGYIDPSVGSYPYWFVTAFGHAVPELVQYYLAEEGKGVRQAELDMPVTEMIAKN